MNIDMALPEMGTEVAKFRLNTWRTGSWGLFLALGLACFGVALASIRSGSWLLSIGMFAVCTGCLFGVRWSLGRNSSVWPLRVFENGFRYDDGVRAYAISFGDVAGIEEETLTYGIGPWNQEHVCRVRLENGMTIWIGNRVSKSANVAACLSGHHRRFWEQRQMDEREGWAAKP